MLQAHEQLQQQHNLVSKAQPEPAPTSQSRTSRTTMRFRTTTVREQYKMKTKMRTRAEMMKLSSEHHASFCIRRLVCEGVRLRVSNS